MYRHSTSVYLFLKIPLFIWPLLSLLYFYTICVASNIFIALPRVALFENTKGFHLQTSSVTPLLYYTIESRLKKPSTIASVDLEKIFLFDLDETFTYCFGVIPSIRYFFQLHKLIFLLRVLVIMLCDDKDALEQTHVIYHFKIRRYTYLSLF